MIQTCKELIAQLQGQVLFMLAKLEGKTALQIPLVNCLFNICEKAASVTFCVYMLVKFTFQGL